MQQLWTADPHPTTGLRYLVDPSRVAAKLRIAEDDGDLLAAVGEASDRFRRSVRHPVHRETTTDTLTPTAGRVLQLPAAPVSDVTLVEVRTGPGTYVDVTDTITGIDPTTGEVERAEPWPTGLGSVRVTYTHGFEVIPGDIQSAVLEAVQLSTSVQPGLSTIRSGDESLSFFATATSGTTRRWTEAVEMYRINTEEQ